LVPFRIITACYSPLDQNVDRRPWRDPEPWSQAGAYQLRAWVDAACIEWPAQNARPGLLSRKNAVPAIFGESGDGDPKKNLGDGSNVTIPGSKIGKRATKAQDRLERERGSMFTIRLLVALLQRSKPWRTRFQAPNLGSKPLSMATAAQSKARARSPARCGSAENNLPKIFLCTNHLRARLLSNG
jgi:hypothetical protein